MDLQLQGKVALVLGAGGGLGGAIARVLAREGVFVAGMDLDQSALAATVKSIQSEGGLGCSVVCDLSDLAGIQLQIEKIYRDIGHIDILVNNTGGPPPSTAHNVAPEQWQTYFNSMVMPLIRLTDLVLPSMRKRNWGRIITSSSSGAIAPIPNLGLSNTLRSALSGWSKSLAREVAADGVTVNIVVPGRILTDRIKKLDAARAEREARTVEEVMLESVASIPVGRYGRPEEYADAVAFLASNRASFITGSIMRVDGGMINSI